MSQWYILYNGTQVGPMAEEQLTAYGLNPNSQVWCEGMPQWVPAYTIPDLMTLIQNSRGGVPGAQPGSDGVCPPPCAYQNPVGQYVSDTEKSKVVAGILALFLGCFGVQYFYCGKVAGGFITILLSCITCFSIWPIVTFVQGIVMLCMTQEEFDRKYVNSTSTFPLF